MATNILTVHAMRNELRERLNRAHVSDYHHMGASDIEGPGLALDFGHVGSTWGQLIRNDGTDTWDVTIGDGPMRKVKSVDEAVTYCQAAGRERVKKLS